jgi:hypothetical protein
MRRHNKGINDTQPAVTRALQARLTVAIRARRHWAVVFWMQMGVRATAAKSTSCQAFRKRNIAQHRPPNKETENSH